MSVPDAVATNIIVFGRGLIRDGENYRLTLASSARVDALLDYIDQHGDAFCGRHGNVVFSGGWSGAGRDVEPPPEHFREASLMLDQAREADIAGHRIAKYAETHAETGSDSTLENVLRIREEDYFHGITFTADNPLGLVAHKKHLNRVDYLARKVFNLPSQAVAHIVAPGADKPTSTAAPESLILLGTRLVFTRANDVHGLRSRQRILVFLNRPLAR